MCLEMPAGQPKTFVVQQNAPNGDTPLYHHLEHSVTQQRSLVVPLAFQDYMLHFRYHL